MNNEMERAFDSSPTRAEEEKAIESASLPEFPARLARTVATQVRYWRERRGLSAKQLSEKTKDLGFQVPRSVIANLENNRRDAVGVAEILILSAALDIPPTMLIAAIGLEETVEVLPAVDVSPWLARGWILGARHPNYRSFSHAGWQDGRRAIAMYDIHRILVNEHLQIQNRIRRLAEHDQLELQDLTEMANSPRGRGALLNHAVQELAYSLDRIRQHRDLIRAEGFLLPTLPPGLAVNLRGSEPAGRHHLTDVTAGEQQDTEVDQLSAPLLFDAIQSRMQMPE